MPTTSTGMGTFTTVFDAIGTGTLTTAYAGNQSAFSTHGSDTAEVYVTYVTGNESSCAVRVEAKDSDGNWWVVPFSKTALDLSMTVDSSERIGIRRIARWETDLRISARIVGTADATTSLTVTVQLGSSRYPIAGNVV